MSASIETSIETSSGGDPAAGASPVQSEPLAQPLGERLGAFRALRHRNFRLFFGGQFVSLIKDSSLLSIIAITEFTWSAQAVNARTFSTLESYLPLALGYLILTLPISLWTRRLERRHKYET